MLTFIKLTDPPKIISPLKRNVYVKTGTDLELNCKAKGLPYPRVQWTRLGGIVKNQTVVLKRVSKRDSGRYVCKAYNAAGEDSVEVIVTVGDEEKSTQTTGNQWNHLFFFCSAEDYTPWRGNFSCNL